MAFYISRNNVYKFRQHADKQNLLPRPFGGVNVISLGDFWQLRPTGQIAIMSNPFGQKVLESGKANFIMSMFWGHGDATTLQKWTNGQRLMHLDRNERSGADTWFSNFLNACREGRLSEDD